MRYSDLIFFSLLSFMMSACNDHGAKDPVNTSYAFPEVQISLGGVIAEQLAGLYPGNSVRFAKPSILSEKVVRLQKQAEELKKNKESVKTESFDHTWREVKKEVTNSFEELSDKDITAWVVLNDSLLKYSGNQGFAEELEKMVYNAPVPEVITEKMIKSFCYTRLYDRIYVNIFGSSSVEYEHTTGGRVRIFQDTKYPFENRIVLKVELQETRYLDLFIHIPQWSKLSSVMVKGVRYNAVAGDYAEVARKWKNGDQVEIVLGFRPEVIRDDSGSIAFSYGPLILSYLPADKKKMLVPDTDPVKYLQFVSTAGKMPTFTFDGIPNETLVLQPFFTGTQDSMPRTAWIKTTFQQVLPQ